MTDITGLREVGARPALYVDHHAFKHAPLRE